MLVFLLSKSVNNLSWSWSIFFAKAEKPLPIKDINVLSHWPFSKIKENICGFHRGWISWDSFSVPFYTTAHVTTAKKSSSHEKLALIVFTFSNIEQCSSFKQMWYTEWIYHNQMYGHFLNNFLKIYITKFIFYKLLLK